MRRIQSFLLIALVAFTLGACSDNNSNQKGGKNTVTETQLTEREKVILSTTADQYFIFDFNTDRSYKEVSVWVEKYESGKLVDELNRIGTEIKDKGTILFTTSKMLEESNQSQFSIGINSDSSTGSGFGPETMKGTEFAIVSGSNPNENIPIKDKMVLASICYSKDEYGISTLSSEFYPFWQEDSI